MQEYANCILVTSSMCFRYNGRDCLLGLGAVAQVVSPLVLLVAPPTPLRRVRGEQRLLRCLLLKRTALYRALLARHTAPSLNFKTPMACYTALLAAKLRSMIVDGKQDLFGGHGFCTHSSGDDAAREMRSRHTARGAHLRGRAQPPEGIDR